MTLKTLRRALLATAVVAAPALGPVSAQDASQDQNQAGGLDTIVVTAQKRTQNLQDVPIAVTAVSNDYIETRNVTSIESLSTLAPNLKVEQTPGNSTAAQISIRGGVTINPALTWEPTVGIYVDGVYFGKTQGSVFDVADIERIEVLRGPQGTLYGRNTLAGAVNIVTAAPTGEFGGRLEGGYGNYNSYFAKASLDLPQLGPFKIRGSGLIRGRDGVIDVVDNPFPGVTTAGAPSTDELDDRDIKSFMVSTTADLTDNLSIAYGYDYSNADQNPRFSQIVSVSDGNIFDPASPFYVGGGPIDGQYFGFPLDLYVSDDRLFEASVDGPVFERMKTRGHRLTLTLDLGDLELKSITGRRKLDWDDALDLDGSPLPLAHTQRLSDYKSFSEELQLTGELGRVNFVLGAYYFTDDGNTENPQFFFGGANRFDSQYAFETDAWAVFGQADFALTDRLTLTGGLRYTNEDKSIERRLTLLGPPDIPLVPAGTSAEETFDNISPTAVLSYEAADAVNLYAKYSQGYKSGGFNGEASTIDEVTRPYLEEEVQSFEIGAKTRGFDGRLQLNAAAFWNEHKDMQLSVFTAQNAASSDIRNAGEARIAGFELEALAALSDCLTVGANYGYLDTEYKEFIEFGVDVADNRAFPHAPSHTFSANADWEVIRGRLGRVNLLGDLFYTSSYFTFPYSLTQGDPLVAFNSEAEGRALVNARLVWRDIPVGETDFEVSLWAKNIFDREYVANFIDFGAGFGGLTNGYFGDPRTYGFSIAATF